MKSSDSVLIVNARLVNEGQEFDADVLIKQGRIEQVAKSLQADENTTVWDAKGCYLIPGMIDDQVHFREPGLEQKGDLATESYAAVAGGITSFMDMPNVNPQTITLDALEHKYQRAASRAHANYAFYLGATNDNLEQVKALDPNQACGVKIFMGASTGNMLVDDPAILESFFRDCPVLIATHCEDTPTIYANEARYREQYGEDVPMAYHADIRSAEACYMSSSLAVSLAKRFGTRLHVLHLTTAKELELFEAGPIDDKQITLEACVHHLFFSADDYEERGALIKCNPSIKAAENREALWKAVQNDVIDIIATDHAPHTWDEKQRTYFKAPAGLPLVQHAVLSLLEAVKQQRLSLATMVQKVSHNVAKRYQIVDRGYIREGYWADLVLVDPNRPYLATHDNSLYKCGWTPFNGIEFGSSIVATWVNGALAFSADREQTHGVPLAGPSGQRIVFAR